MHTHYYLLNRYNNQQQFRRETEREYFMRKIHEAEIARAQAKREATKQKIKAAFAAVKNLFQVKRTDTLESLYGR